MSVRKFVRLCLSQFVRMLVCQFVRMLVCLRVCTSQYFLHHPLVIFKSILSYHTLFYAIM